MANDFEPNSKSLIDWYSERANRHDLRLTNLEIARLGKVWIGPTMLTGIYGWQNGYDDAGDPYFPFQYRLFDKDHLQVRGTMVEGTNNTVGFTLLPPFWPSKNISIWGNVEESPYVRLATIHVNYLNGQATITYET